jgi:hypothetical protein
MSMTTESIIPQEFFNSGVPPLIMFKSDINGLSNLISSCAENPTDKRGFTNKTAELCLIGLVAYFEAFCKNQFAAIINICPSILNNFVRKRNDTVIELRSLFEVSGEINYRLGSLLSEKYDFGSARAVNGLFTDLFDVTPFSKNETEQFSKLLNDRNLLVHHGGIYTIKYSGQQHKAQVVQIRPCWNTLIIKTEDVLQWSEFLDRIAMKTSLACYKALHEFIGSKEIELNSENKQAIESLLKESY